MTSTLETRRKIREFIMAAGRLRALRDEDEIFKAGFVNSLFAMELVMYVERTFPVRLEKADLKLENFASVNAIAELVATRLAHAAPA